MENVAKRFNSDKRKWAMVDFKSLEPMVEVLEYGCHKYSTYRSKDGSSVISGANIPFNQRHEYEVIESGRDNWKKGLTTTSIVESLLRHCFEYLEGVDKDSESGCNIIGHISCNSMFLAYMMIEKPEFDDRSKTKQNLNETSKT